MARLLIDSKRIVVTVVIEGLGGKVEFSDWLKERLPEAGCDYVTGFQGIDEYEISLRADRLPELLRALNEFCDENGIENKIETT